MKKRILALLLMIVILCVSLTSCEALKLINNVLNWIIPGDSDVSVLFQFIFPDPDRCTSHTVVPLEAIAPTCTTPGMSGGQVCQNCGAVIIAQTELPPLYHEFTDHEDTSCNRCGFIRSLDCTHQNIEIIPAVEPTCTTSGRSQGEKCLDCGKMVVGYEIILPSPHIYTSNLDATCNICYYERKITCPHDAVESINGYLPTCTHTGLTEGIMCYHCGEIILVQQEIPKTSHNESDWIIDVIPTEDSEGQMHTECLYCGKTVQTDIVPMFNPDANEGASEGLLFTLNDDKNSYTLIDIGTCADVNVIVPAYHNDKPVTKIGDGAFAGNQTIVSVTIPEGILSIGNGAFRECTFLESITIPNSVTTIRGFAFAECSSLHSITLPEHLSSIEPSTFSTCASLEEITISAGVRVIKEEAFYGCTSLKSILLPEDLETIEKRAFLFVGFNEVTIPSGTKLIEDNAFSYAILQDGNYVELNEEFTVTLFNDTITLGAYVFPKKTTIDFRGTAGDWNNIIIHPSNYNYTVKCTDITFIH